MFRTVKSIRIAAVFAAAGALFSASLACSGNPFQAPTATPTSTATATSTLTPTVTQTPTRTVAPTITYLDWPVVLSDSFDDNQNEWFAGEYENDFVKGRASITDGKYTIDLTAKAPFTWWGTQDVQPSDFIKVENSYISVDVEKIEGPTEAEFGLMFRYWGTDQYIFVINVDHQDYCFMAYADSEWTTIIDYTESSLIRKNGPNQIAVLAEDSEFTFFINGEMADWVKDDTLDTGTIGMGLMGWTAGERTVVEFDNLEVRAPEPD